MDLLLLREARGTDNASTWKPYSPESISDPESIPDFMDDDDVSSRSDGEAEATLVPTAPPPAPVGAGTTLSSVRGGKYSSWPRSEALGVALVVLRRAQGNRDVRSVMLDFLENGLVLSHTFRGEISFQANLPTLVCWSCGRKIIEDEYFRHEYGLEFFSDNDIPSCDEEEAVLGSCLCLPHERSEECKRGYARLVPELVRATGLWREHAAAWEANQDPEWPEPDRHLASNTYHCDFFDVIGELHPPSLGAMEAAGWYLSHNQWRCETTLIAAAFLNPFGGAAAAEAAARAAAANAAAEAVARARDAESAAAAALVTPPRANGYATAGGAVTGRVLEFDFGDTA